MAGNKADTGKLEKHISCLKYTIFCFNIITWLFGAGLFGLAIWIAVNTDLQEWVDHLDIEQYNIGIYILITSGILVMIFSFIGCGSALIENQLILYIIPMISLWCNFIYTIRNVMDETKVGSLNEESLYSKKVDMPQKRQKIYQQ